MWNSKQPDDGRVEQYKRDSGTVEPLMVEQNRDGETLKHLIGVTADHPRVQQWNNQGGRVKQRWWNSRTSNGGGVEQWKRDDEIAEPLKVDHWNREGGKVEHMMGEQWII